MKIKSYFKSIEYRVSTIAAKANHKILTFSLRFKL